MNKIKRVKHDILKCKYKIEIKYNYYKIKIK